MGIGVKPDAHHFIWKEGLHMFFHLEITGSCNLRCAHCYNGGYNRPLNTARELSHSEWLCLIEQANLMGCERFNFSGGEPLLYHGGDFQMFMELVSACSSPVILLTNGHFLTENRLEKLINTGKLRAIRLSIDGLKSHNSFRDGGDYRLTLQKIRMIKERSDIPLSIVTMLHKGNLHEINSLYEKMVALKVDRWNLDVPFYCGNYVKNFSDFGSLSFTEIISAMKKLIAVYINDGKPFQLGIANIYKSQIIDVAYNEFTSDVHPCCYQDIVCVKPDGKIHVCAAYNLEVSDFRKAGSLKDALSVMKAHPFYSMRINDISRCLKCRYLRICGGGCRADSFYLTGLGSEVDPVCCSLLPLIEKEIFPVMPEKERNILSALCDPSGTMPRQYVNVAEIVS